MCAERRRVEAALAYGEMIILFSEVDSLSAFLTIIFIFSVKKMPIDARL